MSSTIASLKESPPSVRSKPDTKDLDLLYSLVALEGTLDRSSLELEKGSSRRACAHIIDKIELWLGAIGDTFESSSHSIVEPNSKTITD